MKSSLSIRYHSDCIFALNSVSKLAELIFTFIFYNGQAEAFVCLPKKLSLTRKRIKL